MTAAEFEALGWPHPRKCAATLAELVAGGMSRFDAFGEVRGRAVDALGIRWNKGDRVMSAEAQRSLAKITATPNPFAKEEVGRIAAM